MYRFQNKRTLLFREDRAEGRQQGPAGGGGRAPGAAQTQPPGDACDINTDTSNTT